MDTVHATCVAIEGWGVLIRGPAGSGKSDLAVRAIDGGARLIADDRVTLTRRGDTLVAASPPQLRGMIEIRGVGILRVEADMEAPLALIADLAASGTLERMPEPECCALLGLAVPRVRLAPFEASAAAKLRFALMGAIRPDCRVR